MSFKKKMLAVTAVGALTVATAVPALALENEFHGLLRAKGNISNIANASSGFATIIDNPKTRTYIEERARLLYSAKANDDLKLVTHFEIDYSKFGDDSYGISRGKGAAIGADEINLETKNVYLDFNIPVAVPINVKVGVQPWIDAYGGLFVNADIAGVVATGKYNNFTNSLAFFRLDDKQSGSLTGKQARDLLVVDSKFAVSKDLKVGASYYLLNDDTGFTGVTGSTILDPSRTSSRSIIHTLGLNGETKTGPVTVNAGAMYQFGNLENRFALNGSTVTNLGSGHLSAFLGKAGAKIKAGPGTASVTALYVSGENGGRNNSNAFQSVHNLTSTSASENTFYEANMHLLMRSKYAANGDTVVVFSSNNKNQGLIGGFAGYDATFGKLYGSANAGFVAVAKDRTHDSKYLGTEINAEVGYKLYDNLTATLLGSYVALGDYFKNVGTTTSAGVAPGKKPNDPFLTTVMLNYVF